VVQLVKDDGKKLTNTINLKNKPFPKVTGVPPAHVIILNILLPENGPPWSQWGLGTAEQNAGACAPNAPTANAPRPAQFQPAQAACQLQIPPPKTKPPAPIQLPLAVSGNPCPSGTAELNMPLPAMRPLRLPLPSSASPLKISGTALANNPQQIFPQVVANNHSLNNHPQTAGSAN